MGSKSAHSVAGDHLEVASEFEEDLPAVLVGVDADAVHGEDRCGFLIHSELITHVADYCCEGCLFGHGDYFEGLIDLGCQDHFEGHFVGTHSRIIIILKIYNNCG